MKININDQDRKELRNTAAYNLYILGCNGRMVLFSILSCFFKKFHNEFDKWEKELNKIEKYPELLFFKKEDLE